MHTRSLEGRTLFFSRFLLLFSVFLLGAALIFFAWALHDARAISSGVIRLHILADSDSVEDQALKLLVRDAILDEYGETLAAFSDVESAKGYFEKNISSLEATASRVLLENGAHDAVSVELCREYYETRAYDGFDLPAGEYTSLRVTIGEGTGKNWFCMVYPPVCTASSEADEALLAVGFSESQVRLLTENEQGYTLRFKVVEVFSECVRRIREGWSG